MNAVEQWKAEARAIKQIRAGWRIEVQGEWLTIKGPDGALWTVRPPETGQRVIQDWWEAGHE